MLGNDMTLADFVSILVLISYYFLVLGIETEDKKNNVRTIKTILWCDIRNVLTTE